MKSRVRTSADRAVGEGLAPPRWRARLTIAAGLVGVLLSCLVFVMLRYRDSQLAKAEFTLGAQARVEAIQATLNDRFARVRALAAFFESSMQVDRDEFQTFAKALLADCPDAKLVAWIKRVDQADRPKHEAASQAEGVTDYQIREWGDQGRLLPAAERREYCPAVYIESIQLPRLSIGLDVATLPGVRSLLERSEESGRVAATRIRLMSKQKEPTPCCVLAVMPVAGKGASLVDRRPVGFAAGVFSLQTVLDGSLATLDADGMRTDLYVIDDEGKPQWVASQSEGRPKAAHDDAAGLAPLRSDRFQAGLTGWEAPSHLVSRDGDAHRSWLPWGVLLSGLALTALLAGYLTLLIRRSVDVERLAARRAMELDAITGAALDAVIMTDSRGRIAYWNPAAHRIFGYQGKEVVGRSVVETLVPPQHRSTGREGHATFAGGSDLVGRVVELTALCNDGTEIPIEASIAPLPNGGRGGVVAIVRDITVRKQNEEVIRRERRQLRHMLQLQERERQLVSYEIHDGLAQQLAAVAMKFQAIRHVERDDTKEADRLFDDSQRLLQEALREARRLISGLRPPVLDESGVIAAIDALVVEQQSQRDLPAIDFEHDVHFDRLASPLEIAIFRVVQEALTNACRYSQSDRVSVRLTQPNGSVHIEVRDWGVGFDPDCHVSGCYGLQGMRERARLMGGVANVVSRPGEGAIVTVDLPLTDDENAALESDG